ncbi:Ger(x)C family germination protein [Evansella vedderi]|uniref:Ger(X)C family germination protein n=1 Tax=Evansella vedderi TaxID=38282 RepID=A0ABU0A066_9BACI|nr:Ger(x)C family spore germination protein [Evansella vedderi]MDQ0255730.1 Ger(x)C family germination protein [Evansella vedderi]
MKTNLSKLLLLFIVISLFAGCGTSSREIDQRTMILAMGIDKDENGDFVVTIQVPVITPQEGGMGLSAGEFEVITDRGNSVWDAIANIEAVTPTVLFFGHLKTVLIGETLAKEGLDEILDLLDRRAPLANQIYLVIIREKTEVDEFLDQESRLVILPALYLDRFFKADQKLSRSAEVKLFEFRRDINMKSRASTIPFAYIRENNIVLEDMAVFKEGKLVGELLGKEAGKGHLLKEKIVENMNYTSQVELEKEEVTVSSRVTCRLDYHVNKTNPVEIEMEMPCKAEIVHMSKQDMAKKKDHIEAFSSKLGEEIKQDTEKAINSMKEINVEPWLIGNRIWVRDPKYYESLNWEESGWRDSKININIDVEIEQTGQRGMLDKKKIGE